VASPCVCVGGGGGCSVATTTVQEYLAAFGYTYNPSDPLSDTYQSIMAAVVTKDNPSGNVAAWKALCEACLRARGLLYCSNTPGDCGTTRQSVNQAALTNLQTLGVTGTIAGQGIKIGSEIASLAGAGGTLLSGVTFGASALLSGILTILQKHAQAEQNQATVLCQLCPQVTAAIIATDAAIYAGSDSQSAGIANVQEIAAQFRTAVTPFTHGADAFAGYAAICDALAMESSYLYMIAFSGQQTPTSEAEPVATATQTPASAVVVGSTAIASQNIPIASTGINAAVVPVTSLLTSLPSWIWIVLAAIVFIAFSGGRESVQEAA
jgi:hypothetical protein